MAHWKRRLLFLLIVAASMAALALHTDLIFSDVRAQTVSSMNSINGSATNGGSLSENQKVKGRSFSDVTKKNSFPKDSTGRLQESTTETAEKKKGLPRITPPGNLTLGNVTSMPSSIVQAVAVFPPSANHESTSAIRPPMTHLKSQSVPVLPSWFYKKLARYPVVPIDKVQRVIIVSYFRSGSSFFGEMLSSTPRTFFHFEPLQMFGHNFRTNDSAARQALDLIGHLFHCEFQRIKDYARWDYEHSSLFVWNHFLWTLCRGKSSVCFNSEAVSKVCSRAPAQVMKVTRWPMSHVRDWLRRNPDIAGTVKIVHLVRDPRGIVASRRRVAWCNKSEACMHQDSVCSEVRADLYSYEELKKALPNSTHRLRYEDLALNPNGEAVRLFEILGLKYTRHVTRFLKTHTKPRKDYSLYPHSTRRNSSTVAFQWRTKLSYEDVVNIQRSCSDVLQRLGYKTITNEKEMFQAVPLVPEGNLTVPVRG